MIHSEAVLQYGNHDGLADTLFPRIKTDVGEVRVVQRETDTAPYQVSIESHFGTIDIIKKGDEITIQAPHIHDPDVQLAFQIKAGDWTALRVTDGRAVRHGRPLEITFTKRDGILHDSQKTGRSLGTDARTVSQGIVFPKDNVRVRQTPFFCEVSRKGKSLRTEFMTATNMMNRLKDVLGNSGTDGLGELATIALAAQIALSNPEQPTYEVQVQHGMGVLYETALHTPVVIARKNQQGVELHVAHETASNMHSYLRTENGRIVEYAVYQYRALNDKNIMVGISVDIQSGRMKPFMKEPAKSPTDADISVQDVTWGSTAEPIVTFTELDGVVTMHDVDPKEEYRKPDKTLPGSLRMRVENGRMYAEAGGDTLEIQLKKLSKDARILDTEFRPSVDLLDTTAMLRLFHAITAIR